MISTYDLNNINQLFNYNYLYIKKISDITLILQDEELINILKEIISIHVTYLEKLIKLLESITNE